MVSTIQASARKNTASLKAILEKGLADQRANLKRHQRAEAKTKRRRVFYRKQLDTLMTKAIKGVRKLLQVHKTKSVQEMLAMFVQVNGRDRALRIYKNEADFGGGYMCWSWVSCEVLFAQECVLLHVDSHFRSSSSLQKMYDLNNPEESAVTSDDPTTILEVLQEALHTPRHAAEWTDEWVVKAVTSIDVFKTPPEVGHEVYMSWLAFLVACSDDAKLAKIIEAALKKSQAV